MSDEQQTQAARIKFRLRRGMLELDALLHKFYGEHYQSLSSEQKDLFERLLDETDADLYTWLIGKNEPEDQHLKQMVEKIRAM